MTEAQFQSALMRGLPGHKTRVENSVAVGVPDINIVYQGKEAWLEMKASIKGMLLLRTMQRGWMENHVREGGKCFIVGLYKDTGEITVIKWPDCNYDTYVYFNKPYLRLLPRRDQRFMKDKDYIKKISELIFQ